MLRLLDRSEIGARRDHALHRQSGKQKCKISAIPNGIVVSPAPPCDRTLIKLQKPPKVELIFDGKTVSVLGKDIKTILRVALVSAVVVACLLRWQKSPPGFGKREF
jgi:hypothetical protein